MIHPAWEYWQPDPEVADFLAEESECTGFDRLGLDPLRSERSDTLVGVRFGRGNPDWGVFTHRPARGPSPVAERPLAPCRECGYLFRPASRRRFCSRECWERSREPVGRSCHGCHATFHTTRARSGRKFCSTACAWDWLRRSRRLPPIECRGCGREFQPPNSFRRFCSRGCLSNYHGPVPSSCLHCGVGYLRPRSKPGRKYCGRACAGAASRRSSPVRECRRCGRFFPDPHYRNGRYCSAVCRGHARRVVDRDRLFGMVGGGVAVADAARALGVSVGTCWSVLHRAGVRVPRAWVRKICRGCGADVPRNQNTYCSRRCWADHADRIGPWDRLPAESTCHGCGRGYAPSGRESRFCSRACAAKKGGRRPVFDAARASRLYAAGSVVAAVCWAIGASNPSVVRKILKRVGAPTRPPGRPKRINDVIESHRPGVGQSVTIQAPENPRLHGTRAVVRELTEWGAFLNAPAAATGQYRALWDEMVPDPVANGKPDPRNMGFTGNACGTCQSVRVVMDGKCEKCLDCGTGVGSCS